jgi:hypothetical protein
MFRHQPQRLGAAGRMLLHVAFAVELVARIEKRAVVAVADECLEFALAERLPGNVTQFGL